MGPPHPGLPFREMKAGQVLIDGSSVRQYLMGTEEVVEHDVMANPGIHILHMKHTHVVLSKNPSRVGSGFTFSAILQSGMWYFHVLQSSSVSVPLLKRIHESLLCFGPT